MPHFGHLLALYPDPVRAMLIVNPHATSTTPLRRDVIARALASLRRGVVEVGWGVND